MVAGTQSSSKGEVEATCSLSDRTTRAMQDEGMGNGARQKGLRAGPRLPMKDQDPAPTRDTQLRGGEPGGEWSGGR